MTPFSSLISGGAVLCKALAARETVSREDVVFGSIFLTVGAVLLLGQPVLNWLIRTSGGERSAERHA